MKAKDYLQQIQNLDTRINQKIKELEHLKDTSTCIGSFDYSKDRVQSSVHKEAPFEKTVNRMIDLSVEINKEIDSFCDKKHEIINQIQGLKDNRFTELLFKRYVEFKRFEVIATEMNYTYQYTVELHGYALQAFEKTYLNHIKTY